MSSLEGQIALVTGGTRGIGSACVLRLAKMGAFVLGTSTTEEGATRISQTLREHALLGEGLVLSLSQESEKIIDFVENVHRQYGPLSILVNNAGICRDNLGIAMTYSQWTDVLYINLSAVFFLSKSFLRPMLKKRYGRIINISSVSAAIGNAGQANYCASKAGLEAMTRSLARESAKRQVTVNCIAPGLIETDMASRLTQEQRSVILEQVPMGRMGTAEEVAYAVSCLASPESSYISGSVWHVNGGMYGT